MATTLTITVAAIEVAIPTTTLATTTTTATTTQETFQPGDILRISYGLFDHVAIFVKWTDADPNEKRKAWVIQHTGKFLFTKSTNSTSRIELQEESVLNYRLLTRPKKPGAVLYRAMSRVGGGNYHLVFENCEHFATWCVTEKEESPQIRFGYFTMASRIVEAASSAAGQSTAAVGIGLQATGLAIDACTAIQLYVKGTLSCADCARRVVFATTTSLGSVSGALIGHEVGSAVVGIVAGGTPHPTVSGAGSFVGGLVGGFLGGNVARSCSQRLMDLNFDRHRARTVREAYTYLDIPPTATNLAVSSAYKNKSLLLHPDKKGGAVETMQHLNLCYELIRSARSDLHEPFPVGTDIKLGMDRDIYFFSQHRGRWVDGTIERTHGNCTYDILLVTTSDGDGDGDGNYNHEVQKFVDIQYIRCSPATKK